MASNISHPFISCIRLLRLLSVSAFNEPGSPQKHSGRQFLAFLLWIVSTLGSLSPLCSKQALGFILSCPCNQLTPSHSRVLHPSRNSTAVDEEVISPTPLYLHLDVHCKKYLKVNFSHNVAINKSLHTCMQCEMFSSMAQFRNLYLIFKINLRGVTF